MYPRNSASPPRISVGAVIQISDGAVQTAGVSIVVRPEGGAETAGAGTLSYGATSGIVYYTPTQAETDYVAFVVVAYKAGCIPAEKAIVTSARSTSGEVQVGGYASGQVPLQPTVAGRTLDVSAGGEAGIDLANVGSPTTTLNLSGVTIKTATDIETDTQDIQTRLPAALVDGRIVANAQVVGDKSGYSLTQVFPANFSLLGIDGAGAILSVTTVAELGVSALQANGLQSEIAAAVWDEPYASHTTAGTFGKLIDTLRKSNTVIDGTVTSASTPTATAFSSNVSYPTGAFKHAVLLWLTGLLSEQNSPIISYNNTNGAITVEEPFTSAPQVGDEFVIIPTTHVHAVAAIVDGVWDESLSGHLASGSTGEALNNSGGSGNPWITDLSTGYTGTQAGNILNQVKAKTDLITSGTIQTSIPVTAQGQITGPLFIGDDYLSANGRAFQWTVALPSGFVQGTSTCRFGMEHAEGATEGASFAVTGTVTSAGGGNVTLSFDVPKATTGTLKAGYYRWSVEIASAGGIEVTRVASEGKKLVEWREKQT